MTSAVYKFGSFIELRPPTGDDSTDILLFVEIEGREGWVSGKQPVVSFHDSGRGGERTYLLVVLLVGEQVRLLVANGGNVVAHNTEGRLDVKTS